MNNIVVLGAGMGGKLAALGVKKEFPHYTVTLIGPESPEPAGLFYFNEKVPGIAEKPINVTYQCLGDLNEESLKDYQIKSRGYYNPSLSVSSFNKVGRTEVGYLLSKELDLSQVTWIKESVISIDEKSRYVTTSNITVKYDKLISTIPYHILFSMIEGKDISQLLQSKPVYVKEVVNTTEDLSTIDEIVVHYDVKKDSDYYRHNTYKSQGKILKMDSESIVEVPGYQRVLRPGKILTDSNKREWFSADLFDDKHPDIRTLGRYARWEYHYLVTDTYRDAIKFIRGDE